MDNHAAVQFGDLEKEAKSKEVVKPKFTTDFPGAVFREGADELTLRADEEGVVCSFIDTTNVGNKRWWPPFVGEDWHAICQAIRKDVEEPEWEALYHKYKEQHQAVKTRKYTENQKAKVLWALKEAKNKGIDGHGVGPRKDGPNEIPSKIGRLGNPFEGPDGRIGKSLGRECTICNE